MSDGREQQLGQENPREWYRSPAKLMFALYLATSLGFLVPTIKSIVPIDTQFQSIAGETAGGDFSVFYIAGQMAAKGQYAELYHPHTFAIEREKTFASLDGGRLFFNYPPTTLLLFTPFATMPYMPAYSLWTILLLAGTALTIHAFARNKMLTAAALLSPAFLWCIITGQIGFLATILMGSGLFMLHKGKPMTAGMLFGLLIIKPHLALALPFCMIATKQWRAIIGGMISSSLMVLLSLLIFGPEAWSVFAAQFSSNTTGHLLNADSDIIERLPTIFVTMMHLTGSEIVSGLLHLAGALLAIAATITIWRTSQDIPARLLSLFIAPAFISPYYFDYDLTGIGLVFAVMMAAAAKRHPEKMTLAALALLWLVSFFMLIGKINLASTGPLFLAILMAYGLYRAKQAPTIQ